MHIDYTRERIRQVAYRVRALVHADTRPADRLRIAGPVDRLAPADAAALPYADARLGMPLGPLWATWWLRLEATVPPEWAGAPVDLLLETNSEATLWLDGEPVQGLVSGPQFRRPDARLRERARAGERIEAAVEIACNGLVRLGGAPPAARAAGARAARLRPRALRAGALRRRGLGARAGPGRAGGADGRAGSRPGLGGRADGRAQPVLQRVERARPRRLAGRPGDPRRPARAPQRLPCPRGHRDRPRPHRHGLAVAARGDLPQVRAQLRHAAAPTRALSRAPLRLLAGAAVRLDQGARPGAVGAHPRAGRGRALAARRRQLGRAGLQPARGRVARAPVPVRPALLRARARAAGDRVLEPRRVRLQRPAAAAHARRGHDRLPHPEAVVEPLHDAGAPHLPLGRHRRLGRARALPARRHLQRRGERGRAAALGARLQGPPAVGPQPAAVRLGRRRRRADAGHARDAGARRGPAGRPAHDHRRPGGVLRRAGGRARGLARGGRRALLRVPPRHLHEPGADQARQPGGGARAARRRAAGGRGRPARPRRVAGGGAGARMGDAAAVPVPRHPARLVDRRRARARRARPRRGGRRGRRRARRRARRAGGPRRAGRAQHARHGAARGGRDGGGARGRRGARVRIRRARRARRQRGRRGGAGRRLPPGQPRARGRARRRRRAALAGAPGDRPRGAARPGQRARALRGPADGLRRVGPRPVPPRDGGGLPARDGVHGRRRRPAARRAALRARARRGGHDGPARAARRGRPPARVPLRDRLARRAPGAEGPVPARRPCAARHVRDAVRRRRAADAPLHARRRGPVRGSRPPVRRPVRARLRRRAAVVGPLRLVGAGRRPAADAAARPPLARPGRGPRRARARLRALPARRELAGGRGHGGGGGLLLAAAPPGGVRAGADRSSPATRPGW